MKLKIFFVLIIILSLSGFQSTPAQDEFTFSSRLVYQRTFRAGNHEFIQWQNGNRTLINREDAVDLLDNDDIESSTTPTLPEMLMHQFNYENGFYIPSAIHSIYVYLRCSEANIIYLESDRYDDIFTSCNHDEFVVYDEEKNEQIGVLQDSNSIATFLMGYKLYSMDWSSSGRYLAYSPQGCGGSNSEPCPQIRIFDVIQRDYLDTSATEPELMGSVIPVNGYMWSPDENYLSFPVCPALINCDDMQIGILDVADNSLKLCPVHGFPIGYHTQVWSPDSQAIAFVNDDRQLAVMNTANCQASIIDEDASRILAWIA